MHYPARVSALQRSKLVRDRKIEKRVMSESLAVYFLKYECERESGDGYAHMNEMLGGMVQVWYSGGLRSLDKEHAGAFFPHGPSIHSLLIFRFDSFHSSFLWVLLFAIPSS
jgi:hypothetical protein